MDRRINSFAKGLDLGRKITSTINELSAITAQRNSLDGQAFLEGFNAEVLDDKGLDPSSLHLATELRKKLRPLDANQDQDGSFHEVGENIIGPVMKFVKGIFNPKPKSSTKTGSKDLVA